MLTSAKKRVLDGVGKSWNIYQISRAVFMQVSKISFSFFQGRKLGPKNNTNKLVGCIPHGTSSVGVCLLSGESVDRFPLRRQMLGLSLLMQTGQRRPALL